MTTVTEPLVTGVPMIKLGGSDAPEAWYEGLVEMRVEVGFRVPARAVLRFDDADYALADSEKAKLGDKVEITVRRATDQGSVADDVVFRGEITGMDIESVDRDGAELVLVAHDRGYRLGRGRKPLTYVKAGVADLVQQIAARHGMTARADSLPGVIDHLMQVDTDLALLDQLADQTGCDWWVDDEVLRFTRRNEGPHANEQVDLALGQNLVRLSVRATALHPDEVVVQGWDRDLQEPIRSSVPKPTWTPGFPQAFANGGRSLGGSAPLHRGGAPVQDKASADRLAQSLTDEVVDAAVKVEGTAIGASNLKLGCKVKVDHAGPSCGTYRVTAVEHVFRRHLETRFTAGPRRPTTLVDTVGSAPLASTDVRRQGLRLATVTNRNDPEHQGRVKVLYKGVADDHESDWARVAMPGSGPDRGLVVLPEVNDEVVVGFEAEGSGQPIVLGGMYSKRTLPAKDTSAVAPRRWTSKRGYFVELKDGDSPAEQHVLLRLEGSDHQLRIGKDKVELVAPAGVPLALRVGSSSSLEFDGNGNITLKGVNIKVEAQGSLTATAGSTASLTANTTLTLEGKVSTAVKGAKVDVQASAIASVTGAMVKIN